MEQQNGNTDYFVTHTQNTYLYKYVYTKRGKWIQNVDYKKYTVAKKVMS